MVRLETLQLRNQHFWGPRVPSRGVNFSMVEIFSNFFVFCDEDPIWTPNIQLVCKISTKIFFDLRRPKGPLGGGVIFSMVEIFSNFVFLVMRTPYGLHTYSLFRKIQQKSFFYFRRPKGPLGGGHFSMVEIFSNCVFSNGDPLCTPNILLVLEISIKIPCAHMDQGSPFEGHLRDQFYFILCFLFTRGPCGQKSI